MNKENLKISHDKGNEVFSVEMEKGKSVDSDIHGNVVIDYDKKGDVVRVNFYEFSLGAFKKNIKAVKDFAGNFKVPLLVR